jgi:hypothetical protein
MEKGTTTQIRGSVAVANEVPTSSDEATVCPSPVAVESYRLGQRINVVGGPLLGAKGTVLTVDRSGRVVVKLDEIKDGVLFRFGPALVAAVLD